MRKTEPRGAIVESVAPGSIADEGGLSPGDMLLAINGKELRDLIDYKYITADRDLIIRVRKANGDILVLQVENPYSEDLGITFNNPVFDGVIRCRNRCVFCFVDQLPEGMRGSLYVKDDDYRLSFLHGNYVTFTNLSEEDVTRIVELRLSPLYVSVHSTDPVVRGKLLGQRRKDDILNTISRLIEARIELHTQVVVCPGINDGHVLDNTIASLASFWPGVRSCAVVPVGLTRHRTGLATIIPFTGDSAQKVVLQVEKWGKKFKRDFCNTFVFASDELYLLSGLKIPGRHRYEDFPQTENGVGLVRLFLDEAAGFRAVPGSLDPRADVSVVTGRLAGPVVSKALERLSGVRGLAVRVFTIQNRFFGDTVTVAGLLTGKDIRDSLKGEYVGSVLLIPEVMLRYGTSSFLDDMTIKDLEESLGVLVKVVSPGGRSLLKACLAGLDRFGR